MNNPVRRLAVIMDPIEDIKPEKDTTLGLLEAAMRRGWQLHYFTQKQFYIYAMDVPGGMGAICQFHWIQNGKFFYTKHWQ